MIKSRLIRYRKRCLAIYQWQCIQSSLREIFSRLFNKRLAIRGIRGFNLKFFREAMAVCLAIDKWQGIFYDNVSGGF